YRQEIADGKRPNDFIVDLLYVDEEAESYISLGETFYRALKESWKSEVQAHSRLKLLQGMVVPKSYRLGNVVPP
ncbi:hypothetical protein BYT27DRAFT_7044866, partial [Phlegmacium glaucopus]